MREATREDERKRDIARESDRAVDRWVNRRPPRKRRNYCMAAIQNIALTLVQQKYIHIPRKSKAVSFLVLRHAWTKNSVFSLTLANTAH